MAYHVSVVEVVVAAAACHVAVVVSLFAVVFLVDFPFLDFVVSPVDVAFLVAELLLVVVFHFVVLFHAEVADVQI